MGSSDGDNEMKFKPSYQIQNINDNNNNIRRNNFNIFHMMMKKIQKLIQEIIKEII
jgi:hypothetical protein